MITVNCKPLSVNEAWQGHRRKTYDYLNYENKLMWLLPKFELPKAPYFLTINVYHSSKGSDIDNFTKPFIDILSKKYGFNDNLIYKLLINKFIVPKGRENIEFSIETLYSDVRVGLCKSNDYWQTCKSWIENSRCEINCKYHKK